MFMHTFCKYVFVNLMLINFVNLMLIKKRTIHVKVFVCV